MNKHLHYTLFIAFYSLLFSASVSAQTLNWAGGIDDLNSRVTCEAVTEDSNQDIYVVGRFQETADFDMGAGTANQTSVGNEDIFIAKYDLNGNFIRVITIGITGAGISSGAFGVTVDASDNIIVAGKYRGANVDFNPLGAPLTASSSGSSTDAFVAKYNSAGQCIWLVTMGGTSSFDELYGVDLDAAGNVYVAGRLEGTNIDINPLGAATPINTAGSGDAVLIKYDANGIHLWNNVLGGTSLDYGYDVHVNGSVVYLAGKYRNTVDFDPGAGTINYTASGGYDGFLASYRTSNGAANWAIDIGTGPNAADSDEAKRVTTDATGNVYLTGYYTNTADLNPLGAGNNVTSNGSQDIFIAKYDNSGNGIWGHSFGNTTIDNGINIAIDGSNIYATGFFNTSIDFDPSGPGVANVPSKGGADIFVAKYNLDGIYQNAFGIGGADNYDRGIGLFANNKTIYLVGYYSGNNIDFDPVGTSTISSLGSGVSWDGFIASYDDNPATDEIAITEWLTNPSNSDAEEEWVEIYNYGSSNVNLKDWRLKDEDTNNGLISSTDLFIAPGDYMILARDKAKFEEHWLHGCPNPNVIDVGMTLTNTQDEIILEDASGTVIWSVAYSDDESVGRATFYTEATYPTNVFGSKASPGVSRSGNDVTGSLGYQSNDRTTDPNAFYNDIGDFGSPLHVEIASMVRGDAMSFDGAGDFVDLGTTTALENTANLSFEAWVNPTSIPNNTRRIFSKRVNNDNRIEITLGSGTLDTDRQHIRVFFANGGSQVVSTTNGTVPIGEWTHIAVTYDGSQAVGTDRLKVYINGIDQNISINLTATTSPSGNINARLGARSDNGNAASNVLLDEVRLWTSTRTETEVRENMHLTSLTCTSNLLSYYQFNGTTATAIDFKGNNDGTITNAVREASTVNVGNSPSSISQSIAGVSTGVQSFNTAKLTLDIETHSGTEDFTVTYQAFTPNNILGITAAKTYQNPMWTVNSSASLDFKADMVFLFPPNTLSNLNESKYSLYWRTMNDDESWKKIATASSVSATSVSFHNISLTGQFMIVQESNDLVSDVRGAMYTFDGIDDCIAVSDNPSLDMGTGDFSLEAWIKTTHTANARILAKGGGGTPLYQLLSNASGSASFYIRNTSGTGVAVTSTSLINDGTWHHIVGVKEGANMHIYIDGVLENTVAEPGGTSDNNLELVIGRFQTGVVNLQFNGSMDEIRIWNNARSEAQIREKMHLTLQGIETGLVAYYQFNNEDPVGTAGGVKDATGINNGTTVLMASDALVASEVAVAGGVSDRVTIGPGGLYSFPNTDVSIEFGTNTPNGEIVVYRLETEKPHGWNSITGDVDNEYFIVENFGTATFDPLLNITFGRLNYINPSDVGLPQASSPFQLYKRDDNAYGATWGSSFGGAENSTAGSNGSIGFDVDNGITSFSQIALVNNNLNSDLPVELLDFTAKRSNPYNVKLNWSTASETNNEGFFIERMLDSETQFVEVGWLEGLGTTLNTTHYETTDNNGHLGISYYRLRQVDFDGTTSYSEVRAVRGESSGNYIDVSFFPNPVKDQLSISFKQIPKNINSATVKILSIDGKALYESAISIKSNQVVHLNAVNKLHPGVYVLTIETNDEELVLQRFIKE